MHPAAAHIMQFFAHAHLPDGGPRETSALFGAMAQRVADTVPDNPEKTVALRKLLEAKDAAVRAAIVGDCRAQENPPTTGQ